MEEGKSIVSSRKEEFEMLRKAAKRELSILNGSLKNRGVFISLSDFDIDQICEDIYQPDKGWRDINRFFVESIKPKVLHFMMSHPEQRGVLEMNYDWEKKDVVLISIVLRWSFPANDGVLSSAFARL